MATRVLISFFSDDRLGVIEDLSGAIASADGNWLDSELARMGGRFTGILSVQVPLERQDDLAAALAALSEQGVTATMTSAGDQPAPAVNRRQITVLGPDRSGIVHELTKALRSAGFNITSMSTSVETAPMSGEPLFRASASVELSESSRLDELEWQLDAMAEAMTLEIDISED